MPTVNITNIDQQDVIRNRDFNITKEFTIALQGTEADIITINNFEYLGNNFNENVQVTLEVDGSAYSIGSQVLVSSTFKLRLQGRYDNIYDQDQITYVPGGKSTALKDAVITQGDNPSTNAVETEYISTPERFLTDEEFAAEQEEFPTIVKPITVSKFIDVPRDADLIKCIQDQRDNIDVIHNTRFTIAATSDGGQNFQTSVINESFRHEDVRTDNEGFRTAIQQHVSLRLTPFETTTALASGQSKLLGNITDGNINTITNAGEFPTNYADYWNSAIAGNVCKWRPVETNQGEFDFRGADVLQSFCRLNGIKMIWHTLLWGANQGHPSWFEGLSESDSKAAVQAWFKAIADRYGDDIYGIQVLNEIIPGHQEKTETVLKPQLGGAGVTGYDWIIWVYEQARYYFPNALLWTNDFGMMNTTTNAANNRNYMYGVSKALSDRGLVDAFGMQSHYFNVNDLTPAAITNILNEVQLSIDVPVHITELDISGTDQEQLDRYQKIFPAMWNHRHVERVTIWGWIIGETWRHDQGHVTGLINRDGTGKRPALAWLETFMETGVTYSSSFPENIPEAVNYLITEQENEIVEEDYDYIILEQV